MAHCSYLQEGDLVWAFMHQPLAGGFHKLLPIPSVELKEVEYLIWGGEDYYFCLQVMAPQTLRLTRLPASDMVCAFSHLVLVGSIMLLPLGPVPLPHSKQELAMLSPSCLGRTNYTRLVERKPSVRNLQFFPLSLS